jgi:HK97 gp10 family phage protein
MAELKSIEGLKELQAAMRQLPQNIGRNVLRGAVNAGASVIRNEVRDNAPVYEGKPQASHAPAGALRRAVYQKQIREASSWFKQVFYVSVRSGKSQQKKGLDAYYWRFVEFGTKKMAARPFLRPAFESKKYEAAEAIKQYLARRIPLEAEKLGRKK